MSRYSRPSGGARNGRGGRAWCGTFAEQTGEIRQGALRSLRSGLAKSGGETETKCAQNRSVEAVVLFLRQICLVLPLDVSTTLQTI